MVAGAGHEVIAVADFRKATVVAVGNDFDFSYERLTAAARAVAAGAPLVTPNIDPRLPMENGDFMPGCGAIVAAVSAAGGAPPIVVGKPEPPLFRIALARLGLAADRRPWWATAWSRTLPAAGERACARCSTPRTAPPPARPTSSCGPSPSYGLWPASERLAGRFRLRGANLDAAAWLAP